MNITRAQLIKELVPRLENMFSMKSGAELKLIYAEEWLEEHHPCYRRLWSNYRIANGANTYQMFKVWLEDAAPDVCAMYDLQRSVDEMERN